MPSIAATTMPAMVPLLMLESFAADDAEGIDEETGEAGDRFDMEAEFDVIKEATELLDVGNAVVPTDPWEVVGEAFGDRAC